MSQITKLTYLAMVLTQARTPPSVMILAHKLNPQTIAFLIEAHKLDVVLTKNLYGKYKSTRQRPHFLALVLHITLVAVLTKAHILVVVLTHT